MRITDETLIAYVDNELDDDQKAQVEHAARMDAVLARRILVHRRLRDKVSGAFADIAAEPAPTRLVDAVGAQRSAAAIIDLAQVRAKRAAPPAGPTSPAWTRWAMIAACAVLVAGLGVLYASRLTGGSSVGGGAGELLAQNGLARALDVQLAADDADARQTVKIGLSFRSADGHDCRTFQVDQGEGFAGLACREPEGWRIRLAIAKAPPAANGAYRTAATAIPPAVIEAVQGSIVGSPFDARQEIAARATGWRK